MTVSDLSEQPVNKSDISNKPVDIIRLVTRLFQQGCYDRDIAILVQPCVFNLVIFLTYSDYIMTVSDLLEQPCNKSDNAIKLVVYILGLY